MTSPGASAASAPTGWAASSSDSCSNAGSPPTRQPSRVLRRSTGSRRSPRRSWSSTARTTRSSRSPKPGPLRPGCGGVDGPHRLPGAARGPACLRDLPLGPQRGGGQGRAPLPRVGAPVSAGGLRALVRRLRFPQGQVVERVTLWWTSLVSRRSPRDRRRRAGADVVLAGGLGRLEFKSSEDTMIPSGSTVYTDNVRYQHQFGSRPDGDRVHGRHAEAAHRARTSAAALTAATSRELWCVPRGARPADRAPLRGRPTVGGARAGPRGARARRSASHDRGRA